MTSLTYNVHIQNIDDKLLNEQYPPIPIDRAHRVVLGTGLEQLEHVPERIRERFSNQVLLFPSGKPRIWVCLRHG